MSFYESLCAAMNLKGISASELSRRTGLYQSYFSKLKRGDASDVTWEKALLIIDALGMTPSEFAELERDRHE